MSKEDAKISCSIFQKQEAVIKDITNKINAIEGVAGKAVFAEALRKEVDVLLACQDYKDTSLDTFDGAKPRPEGRGSKAPLSINPEQTSGLARGASNGLIVKITIL